MKLLKPYRLIFLFVMLFATVFQYFQKELLVVDYVINTSDYAAFCINKNKPKMHCNGHCQLVKEAEDIDRHQNPMQNFNKNVEIVLFCQNTTILNQLKANFSPENYKCYQFSKGIDFVSYLLKPPQLFT